MNITEDKESLQPPEGFDTVYIEEDLRLRKSENHEIPPEKSNSTAKTDPNKLDISPLLKNSPSK